MKTLNELNKIANDEYAIEEGLWFFFDEPENSTLTEEFCHGEALSILLKDEIVYVNTGEKCEQTGQYNTLVLVDTNDVMMWACGDAEILMYDQIEPLIKLHLDNKKWGAMKWACLPSQNNMQPQYPIKRDMIKDGYWDNELESLHENKWD